MSSHKIVVGTQWIAKRKFSHLGLAYWKECTIEIIESYDGIIKFYAVANDSFAGQRNRTWVWDNNYIRLSKYFKPRIIRNIQCKEESI